MRVGTKVGSFVVIGLLAAATAVTMVSGARADTSVASALAVRGPHDDLTEGAAVIGLANTVKLNGVDTREVNFYGAGGASDRSEIDLFRAQVDALAAGTYPVSPSNTVGTVNVTFNLGGVGCGAATGGSVTILTPPAYDSAGALTGFAADLALHCAGTADYSIELRYHDSHGWSQLVVSALPQNVSATVGSTVNAAVRYTAHGTVPIVPGAASIVTDSWDGFPYWHLTSDGCHAVPLAPGAACSVGVRFAPMVANGSPCGNEAATVSVPDGRPTPSAARFSGCVYPLPGQATPPTESGHFHHINLVWGPPGLPAPGAGASDTPTYYEVYEVRPGGPVLVTTSPLRTVSIAGLPTGYRAQYEIRAVYDQGGGAPKIYGPMSLPGAVAATSSRELLYANRWAAQGVYAKSLSPAGAPQGATQSAMMYADDISVGADRRYMAIAAQSTAVADSQVWVAPVDESASAGPIADMAYPYDADPAVAPDSSAVVYTAAPSSAATGTLLRMWHRSTGTITTVTGGANLTQAAYAPDGKSLVAVASDANGTHLVRLVLATGVVTTINGGSDASEPAVAGDGRITFVRHTTGADDTTLAVLAAGGTTPVTVTGVPVGINAQPSWDPSGAHLDYVHRDASDAVPQLHEVTPAGGTDNTLLDDGASYVSAPVIVAEAPDATAPSVTVTSPASGTTHTSLSTSVTVTWSATDAGTGVRSSDVRYESAAFGHGFGSWVYPAADQNRAGTGSLVLTNPAGATICVSVRVRDNAGNVSAWSASRCVTSALDDRSLTGSGSVIRGSNTAYFHGTYSLLSKSGAFLTKSGVSGTRVTVVATTCSTCGSVKVYIGSVYLGTISLHASSTHHKVIFHLPTQSVTRSGTLMIKSTSASHDYIDGFAVEP